MNLVIWFIFIKIITDNFVLILLIFKFSELLTPL